MYKEEIVKANTLVCWACKREKETGEERDCENCLLRFLCFTVKHPDIVDGDDEFRCGMDD